MEDQFLPTEIKEPSLPDNEEWTPESAIERITRLSKRIQRLKPAVEDIIMDFWIAHEMIVNKKVKGWTWGRFCEECGYSTQTAINWFRKYGMAYTQISGPKTEPKNLGLPTPPPTTAPELKESLKEVNRAIENKEITDKDLENTRKALSKREVNTEQKEKWEKTIKPKSQINKLHNRLVSIGEQLTYLADGTLQPEEGDEVHIKAIRMCGPSIIWQFHKLGVDLNKVYRTLINPKKELSDYESQREARNKETGEKGFIDITPGEEDLELFIEKSTREGKEVK